MEIENNIKLNESQQTPQTKIADAINTPNIDKYKTFILNCNIRRKPGLVAIHGQDPNERVYKIGASLDKQSGGNLKGITGDLEKLFMPEIVQIGASDFGFKKAVDEYWSNISKLVPPDEPFKKDFEQGVVIKLTFKIRGEDYRNSYKNANLLEEKIQVLNSLLVKKITIIDKEEAVAILDNDCIADYLLLTYCLKYNKVANVPEDINKSPRIDFFLYEKSISVKTGMNFIEKKDKAVKLFSEIRKDINKLDAVLFAFNKNPNEYPDTLDKVLAIDDLYLKNTTSVDAFIKAVEDTNYKIRVLIRKALEVKKLNQPVNTTSIYYNDKLIGSTIDSAINYLITDEVGKEIKNSLEKELNII